MHEVNESIMEARKNTLKCRENRTKKKEKKEKKKILHVVKSQRCTSLTLKRLRQHNFGFRVVSKHIPNIKNPIR